MPKIHITRKKLGVIIVIFSVLLSAVSFWISYKFKDFQGFGYFGVFLVNLFGSATIIFPVPSFAATIAVGAVSSPILTAIFSSLGSTLGELTGYFVGKGGGEISQDNSKIEKVKKWMDKYGLWAVFILAIIPNPLFDVAGIVSGISNIPLKKYLFVVFTGKLIKFTILAYTGFGFLKAITI